MKDLVSIIVPVYNAEAYIESTIAMVKEQTYTKWELILVNDCSADNSAKIIEPFLGEQIQLISKKTNEGAAKARNTGLDAARGRYIAFLDADDLWHPEKLQKEMAYMKEKGAAFVFTAYEFGDQYGRGTGKIVHVPEKFTYKEALKRTIIFTTTVLFDTEKMDKALIYMPDVKSEDTATWWNILRHGVTAYGLDENLAVYRRPAKSLSSNKLEAIKRIWHLYRKVERLPLLYSAYCFLCWALGAVLRRM